MLVISGPLDPFVDFNVPVAGTVTLNSTDIQTESRGNGLGGDITINALDTVTLDHSTLSADVNNGPNTELGDIVITSPEFLIIGGGITAQTTGSQSAGSISLATGKLTTQEGSRGISLDDERSTRVRISSSSQGSNLEGSDNGKAGNILLLSAGPTELSDTDIQTESNGNGQGGSINLVSEGQLVLEHTTFFGKRQQYSE